MQLAAISKSNKYNEVYECSVRGIKTINSCYQNKLGSTCPTHSKANLLTVGCGEEKYRVYCRAPNKENRQLMLKRPELPSGFQGRVFKGNIRGECCRLTSL